MSERDRDLKTVIINMTHQFEGLDWYAIDNFSTLPALLSSHYSLLLNFILVLSPCNLQFVIRYSCQVPARSMSEKGKVNVDKTCGGDDKYAVVQFKENDKLGDVSVIPTNWLVDEHLCWWPTNSRITRTLIIKRSLPNSDWSQYDCNIHNLYDSYANALEHEKKLAATSESEGEQRPGKRKVKQKKTADYESIVHPPSVYSDLSDDDSSAKEGSLGDSGCENLGNIEVTQSTEDELRKSEISGKCSFVNCGTEDIPLIEHLDDTADVTVVENLPVVVSANHISDIMEMIADIRSICQITLNKVNSIVEHSLQRQINIDSTDDAIKEYLPLKTMDNLLNLEDLLKNNKTAAAQLMNKLVLVGGSDYKNLIRRCLQQIIEDELAQYCSWTGQKQNFRISDLKIMDILKQSVKEVFKATTDKEFELIVMEWMRFAKQRLKRKE
ncbi:unnamed protein product [Phaedon cochleariae]|uniref:DUF4806 domain-containing protein n=1 Tax=Phaedon cochleariae TaxID=80249 RepID=A0A9N9SFN2_PHACE|nr:unnamed protein product [Phaedon cochleariae]